MPNFMEIGPQTANPIGRAKKLTAPNLLEIEGTTPAAHTAPTSKSGTNPTGPALVQHTTHIVNLSMVTMRANTTMTGRTDVAVTAGIPVTGTITWRAECPC